jgi:hypothetical protein
MEVANISEQIMYTTANSGLRLCTATITKGKNRLKSYRDKNSTKEQFFLNDGEEFEIELFNSKTAPVLARISINGKRISDRGIILNPGQRVFLERFFDSPEKFKFSTYEVEDSKEAKQAISENGDVKVEFYDEQTISSLTLGGSNIFGNPYNRTYTYTPNYGSGIYGGNINLTGNLSNGYYNGTITTSNYSSSSSISNITNSSTFTSSVCMDSLSDDGTKSLSIETGRVDKGSKSDQGFIDGSGDFNSWYSNLVECKILPISAKPVEISELRNYCTECGTRNKKTSWKFCPTCGNKF